MSTPAHIERQRATFHAALGSLAQSLGSPVTDGLKLWRKLRRIEADAHQFAEQCCNYGVEDCDLENHEMKIKFRVARVFGGKLPPGFFINGDPRGYALKLEANSVPDWPHTDWGRYQILAPEIN